MWKPGNLYVQTFACKNVHEWSESGVKKEK